MLNPIAAADMLCTKAMFKAGELMMLDAADPTAGINKVGELIQNVVTAAGVVLCLFGFVQIGVSISQHDSQQRINGFLFLAGGIIVAFAPTFLTTIGVTVPWGSGT